MYIYVYVLYIPVYIIANFYFYRGHCYLVSNLSPYIQCTWYTGMITLTSYRRAHVIRDKVRRLVPGNTLFISSPPLLLPTYISVPLRRGLEVGCGSHAAPPRVLFVFILKGPGRWKANLDECDQRRGPKQFLAAPAHRTSANLLRMQLSKVKIYIQYILTPNGILPGWARILKREAEVIQEQMAWKSERKIHQIYFLCRQHFALLGPLENTSGHTLHTMYPIFARINT